MLDDGLGLACPLVGNAHDFVGDHFHGKGLEAAGVATFFMEGLDVIAKMFCQFNLCGCPSQLGSQRIGGPAFRLIERHGGARQVGQLADFVQDGTAHAAQGEVFKIHALIRVEGARCLQEPDHAHLDQFVELHERGNPHLQMQGYPLDQAQVLHDQRLAVVADLLVKAGGVGHQGS